MNLKDMSHAVNTGFEQHGKRQTGQVRGHKSPSILADIIRGRFSIHVESLHCSAQSSSHALDSCAPRPGVEIATLGENTKGIALGEITKGIAPGENAMTWIICFFSRSSFPSAPIG
ncbi:MAG: hypothetical protein VB089_09090 [Anaerolineaceae bacterium]|nr:hypothetical protein [Anaerolineaceae bacterium]